MKRNMRFTMIMVLGLVFAGSLAFAATEAVKPAMTNSQGLEAARALAKITGIAISPLLGVGAIGAYDYFTCPADQKDQMPWYGQLKFWLPALLLVGAVAFKDAAGATLPPGLKKPFDVAEGVESKVSGLVAVGAVVPSIAAIFHSTLSASATSPVLQAGMLGMDFTPLLNILTIPLAMTCFVLVWLVGHVIDVMILVSPWGGFDAVLKGVRTLVLGALAAVSALDPKWGAIISVGIVIFAYFVAGWTFRLMVFGVVFTWDFVTVRRRRFTPETNGNWMFTARKIEKAPVRSYGRLVKTADEKLTFEYRPWLFLPQRTVTLPAGKYAVGRGLFYPDILLVDGEKIKTLLSLPPRYKKHEEALGKIYAIADVRDTGMLKGIKAVWRWFTRNLFGAESKEAFAAAETV